MHELVKKARLFAEQKHAGQKYGSLPVEMIVHLDAVYAVLLEFGETDEIILAAAFLHDILEDTPTYRQEIEETFGKEVLEFIEAVTDGVGKNRAERKASVYKKLQGHWRFKRLKIADRIANMRYSKAQKSPQLSMYIKEYPEFRAQLNLGDSDPNKDMWDYLDVLMKNVTPSTFKLLRISDVSGVSGIGIVAEGVVFTNGKCAITWYGKVSSVTVYNNLKECEQIHGHDGKTKFVFDNEI